VFAGMGAFVSTQSEMLLLRFLVGLGVGGVWPNAVALVSECWPDKLKPTIAGLMGAALNAGILMLSQIARVWHITADSWRWIFHLASVPALLGIVVLIALPESPTWLAERKRRREQRATEESSTNSPTSKVSILKELFRPPLLRMTLVGILLGSIPLIGAWAASKWMIPWADAVGKTVNPGYKAIVQGWWALGAVMGSFFGAQIASWLGRRCSYAVISLGATSLTLILFLGTAPLQPSFIPLVFAQAFVATLFFGWLPLYLPDLFPTHVRATGSGIAYNAGRFATAFGVLAAGALFKMLDGSYPKVGSICGLVYLLGAIVIIWVPNKPNSSKVS
jgi:SHS family sialic acid transporter-like MFS transporter